MENELVKMFGLTNTKVKKSGGSRKSKKEKLIDSINTELNVIESRIESGKNSDLKIDYMEDGIPKTKTDSDRFWRLDPTNKDEVILQLKVRKLIWNWGLPKTDSNGNKLQLHYVRVKNDIKEIKSKLIEIRDNIMKIEEDNKMFLDIK